ncbi:MAG TPA: type II toxin-antitoxin system PemK/MazF family toxin [Candidatus Binatia bacterium]|nr:type II toxin-antitoxin system PemK/MazF family toxin [Candidatus Binatia bacterium]
MASWRRGSKPPGWYPRRREICLVDLDKPRPALVFSSDSLNAHSLDVCVLPISTIEHKAFSLRPRLKAGEGGLDRESWVKCDQPTTVQKQLVMYPPLGILPAGTMGTIEAAVKTALELP